MFIRCYILSLEPSCQLYFPKLGPKELIWDKPCFSIYQAQGPLKYLMGTRISSQYLLNNKVFPRISDHNKKLFFYHLLVLRLKLGGERTLNFKYVIS